MGNLVPAQMYNHSLVTIKGPSRLNRLDFAIAPTSGQDFRPGMAVSIDSVTGLINAGVPAGAAGNRPMPMFAIQDVNAFDANSDKNNISGGVNSALVATGGFEVESTEFLSAQTVYPPNTLLKSNQTAAPGQPVGQIQPAGASPYGAVPVLGVVSKGVNTNRDGISVLRFWTVYLPAGV